MALPSQKHIKTHRTYRGCQRGRGLNSQKANNSINTVYRNFIDIFAICVTKRSLKCHQINANDFSLMLFVVFTGSKLGCLHSRLFTLLHPPCPCVVVQDSADSSFHWEQHDKACSATAGKLFSPSSLRLLPANWQPRGERGPRSSILNSCKWELNWASSRLNVARKQDMWGCTGQFHTLAEQSDSWRHERG